MQCTVPLFAWRVAAGVALRHGGAVRAGDYDCIDSEIAALAVDVPAAIDLLECVHSAIGAHIDGIMLSQMFTNYFRCEPARTRKPQRR